MKCPKCKKEIKKVDIITLNWQEGKLKGNKIIGYGIIEYIDDSIRIECPECGENIINTIKQ